MAVTSIKSKVKFDFYLSFTDMQANINRSHVDRMQDFFFEFIGAMSLLTETHYYRNNRPRE